MKKFIVLMLACLLTSPSSAQRGRAGGGGGFHAGGMARPAGGGGMQRPAPQVQRPQPQMQRPQVQRPQVSIPQQRPQPQRPMPGGGMTRPTTPTMPTRPTKPPVTRPGGGITPGGGAVTRPTIPNRPTNPTNPPVFRPTQPTLPSRPPVSTLPGTTRPSPWPSNPNRPPVTRPGDGSINKPTTPIQPLPGRPGGGMDVGTGKPSGPFRPTNPNLPDRPVTRPNLPDRPVTRPNLPDRPTTLPGTTRPTLPVNRPDNRPIVRPPTNRPIINDNINIVNRPNTIINTRPSWSNINNVTINNINNHWNQTIVNRPTMHNYWNNHPNRMAYWGNWGGGVRNNWRYAHMHRNWFGPTWWNRYCPPFGGWHYHYWLPYYSYNYWWRVPTWVGLNAWFSWNLAANAAWQQPIYYDYGLGGNVYSVNNTVYIGGQEVSSVSDFAKSAAVLATVDPPKTEEEAAAVEWMPLGTFAMSTGEKDTQPTRVVQLAITKDGILSGTLYNYETEQSVAIQGRVDKETQRVAFRLGERDNLIAETGIYNLTQNEVPVLVHFGTEKTERFLFVRLSNEDEKSGNP